MRMLTLSILDLDQTKALTLRDLRKQMRGRGGRQIALDTLRRWASPKRGYRPAGPEGEAVQLPTVHLHGEHMTMQTWIDWFNLECESVREAARKTIPLKAPPSESRSAKAAAAATKRLRERGFAV